VSGGPPAEARSGAVTLRVEGRTELAFGYRNDNDRMNGKKFRAITVDPRAAPEWHDDAIVVAMGPFGTTASRPLGVVIDIPVTAKLAPLDAVEFLVLVDDYASVDVGRFVVEATGHVSADGRRVETDLGEGISRLSWLAVRLRSSHQASRSRPPIEALTSSVRPLGR